MTSNSLVGWLQDCGIVGLLILLLDLLLLPMCLMVLVSARPTRGRLFLPVALALAPLLLGGIGMGMGYASTERILLATSGEASPLEREQRRAVARQPLWLGLGSSIMLLSLLGMAPLMRKDE